jgi:hypothetical protein
VLAQGAELARRATDVQGNLLQAMVEYPHKALKAQHRRVPPFADLDAQVRGKQAVVEVTANGQFQQRMVDLLDDIRQTAGGEGS